MELTTNLTTKDGTARVTIQPKIALQGHWMEPQDFSEYQHAAEHAILETSFGCVIYGYSSARKFNIYLSDNKTVVKPLQSYKDGISLALGIYTINLEHDSNDCKLLICNCKVN